MCALYLRVSLVFVPVCAHCATASLGLGCVCIAAILSYNKCCLRACAFNICSLWLPVQCVLGLPFGATVQCLKDSPAEVKMVFARGIETLRIAGAASARLRILRPLETDGSANACVLFGVKLADAAFLVRFCGNCLFLCALFWQLSAVFGVLRDRDSMWCT